MKVIKILTGLFILIIIALGIFISTFDVNQYKDEIIMVVKQKTGREFDVAGEFKLGLSLIPTVRVEQVRLGNAKWASSPDMIKVKSFEIQLGLIPLLSGNIKINQLLLDSAEIALETDKQGQGNWEFDSDKKTTEQEKPKTTEANTLDSISINEINIKNSSLAYKDGKTGKLTQAKIDEFVVEGGTFSQSLNIVLKAVYNEIPISVDGKMGSLASLAENKDFPLDIKAQIGDATAKISGSIAEPKTFKGADLNIDFKANTLSPFAKILEKKLPELGAIDITGHVAEAKGKYQLEGINAKALSSQMEINGQMSAQEPLKEFDLNVKLETNTLANFNQLKEMTGREFPDSGPLQFKGHVSEKDGFYLLDAINATLGKDLLALNGKLSAGNPLQGFDLEIKFNAENLAKYDALAGQKLPKAGPIQVAGHVSEKDGIYLFKGVNAELAKSKLTIDGKLTNLKKTDGSDLNINFQSASLADLNGLTGSQLPALGPVSLIANVSDSKGSYHLKDMKFTADKTDLAGNMVINIKGERPAVTATLSSNLIDLTPFDSRTKPEKQEKKSKVFSPDPLPLDALKKVDANLDVNAKKIKTTDMDLDNVKLVMALTNGKLAVKPLNANVAGGVLSTTVNLDASTGKTGILDTKIDIKGIQPSKLNAYKEKFTGGKTDLDIDVNGSGKSVAAIMAGLTGKFLMQMGPGTFKSSTTDAAASDVLSSLKSAIYSGGDTGNNITEIICGVMNFKIKDGIATADKGIAINTKKMNIIGSGIIDLKTEKLDIGIDPQAREGVGISAGQLAELVRIGGTLAEPKAVPDTKAAFKAAASAGAAVATGGLSILAQGLFDKSTADEDPCATALGKKPAKPAVTEIKKEEAPKSTTEKAADAVKDTGSAIKDTFKGLFD